jgi:hypothetical protein
MADLYGNPWQPSESLTDLYWGQNPDLAYRKKTDEWGVDPFSVFGKFVQGQQGEAYQGYAMRAPGRDANYSFLQDLDENGGLKGLERRWRNLTPQQRGESPGLFTGRVRNFGI